MYRWNELYLSIYKKKIVLNEQKATEVILKRSFVYIFYDIYDSIEK